jgi:uroporphyrinogen III methyltransferase/synthase
VIAKDTRGEGIAEAMLADGAAGTRVLVLRAEVAREIFPEALRGAGCAVDVVPVYHTEPPPPDTAAALAAELASGRVDAVTFTSSSTAANLADLLGRHGDARALLGRACVASIGPITTATCEERGIKVDVTAPESTFVALLDALESHFARQAATGADAHGKVAPKSPN